MNTDKKLFLLDAYALIYRAYYAFIRNPRYNSKGENTSATFGFTKTLIEIINNEHPNYIAVVFDSPEETLRAAEYAEYKANREETPEDIRNAIPWIKKIIEAFHIPILIKPGYEADDIIGTIAYKAQEAGFITYMMTPDKDFAQLVTENILMYKPAKGGKKAEIWGPKEVRQHFEIDDPKQVIDILGLWGDAVDNIPGVPGIGEKTAKKLIKQYGSIENLLQHTHELKGKLKENLEKYADQALLSKKLATIDTNVPVDFDPEALQLSEPDKEQLTAIFSELEFRTLAKQFLGEEIAATPKSNASGQMDLFGRIEESGEPSNAISSLKTIDNTPHQYHFIDTPEKHRELVLKLTAQTSVCFDTETTSTNALDAELVGMSFSFAPHEAYYIPFSEDKAGTISILNYYKPFFENPDIEKTGQNLKYDIKVLKNYGIDVRLPYFDTMVAHYLAHPEQKHSMDELAEVYLGYKPVSIETLIGKKGKHQKSMRTVPQETISHYAAEDADITFQLKKPLLKELEQINSVDLFRKIEVPLIKVLADMEWEGVCLDTGVLQQISDEITADIQQLEKAVFELAGTTFNLDSPKQLGDVLFNKMKIVEKPKKTKTGQFATNEDVLSSLRDKHEIIPKILEYRTLKKLKTTYVDALPKLINPKTGRLHTTYMQTVAATGRLSSTNPNLQNIPIRNPRGQEVRKAFVPRNENYRILSADYSQIELRIIAALSEDENMIADFLAGKDIHAATASRVFEVPPEQVDRNMRGKAKSVNFGIIYGVSAFGLSQNLNISRKEAKEIIDNYFKKYPKIKAYMDNSIAFAREHGYVETIMHRRRYLPDINSRNAVVRGHAERNAINSPIQGSAADIIKVAMINIHQALESRKMRSKLILQVHDELILDVYKPELDEVKNIVKDKMENAVSLKVPLTVDMNDAGNWLDAH